VRNNILTYLQGSSRNKLIISFEEIPGIHYLNIGEVLSEFLNSGNVVSWHPLKIKDELHKILAESIEQNSEFGEILSIKNVGILLEGELQIDFLHFLEQYSLQTPLFLIWNGETDDNTLYFLSKEKGKKIPIKNLSFIKI
jgi:hypothetical protein